MSEPRPVISLHDLGLSYRTDQGVVPALRKINLEVRRGEFLAVAGPSGSGKTSLLKCIGGLIRPGEGEIRVQDHDLAALTDRELSAYRNRTVGFVFQAFHLNPRRRVQDSVMLPAAFAPMAPADLAERARQLLAELGIEEMARRRVGELSGGQRQRVAVARALILEPVLLLADEPLGNLDLATARVICEVFSRRNREQAITVVAATHDRLLLESAGRVVCMESGILTEDAPVERLAPGGGEN